MKKQEVINKVNEGISSIYTKEDVINIINQIEDTQAETPSFDGREIVKVVMNEWHDKVHEIFSELEDEIASNEIVDMNECQFYLEHDNRIVLNGISFDRYEIENKIEGCRDSLAQFISKAIIDACTPAEEEDTSIDEQVEQGEQEQYEQ
tara:strand:+ start:1228 stop:1674 length:447 start_codon:yes stop_codon:yes gene_type:complete